MRPTKFTPEIAKLIVETITEGGTKRCACDLAGISPDTLYAWVRKGESGDPDFADFSDAVKRADAVAEMHHVRRIGKGDTGWQSSAWWLERRVHAEWRKPPDVIAMTPGLGGADLKLNGLTREEALQLVALKLKASPSEAERKELEEARETISMLPERAA